MTAVAAALASIALAGLVAVAAYTSVSMVAAAVTLAIAVLAVGWGSLLELPDPRGSALVVCVTGAAGAVAVALTSAGRRPLTLLAAVLALGLLAAFAHELLRDSRDDLVESLTGTLSGQVMALVGVGWVLLRGESTAPGLFVVAAAATIAARIAGSARIGAWSATPIGSWLATVVGASAGLAALVVMHVRGGTIGYPPGAAVAICAALAVAGTDRLCAQQAASRTALGALAASAAGVLGVGAVAYAVAGLLAV